LSPGVTLTAGGSLDLRNLTSLPPGVTLTAGGSLYLWNLTSLPEGVTLTAGGLLDLHSLTSLPPGTTLTAGGRIDLRSLTSLPPGVTLTAGGLLDLRSLTSLPPGVTLTAGGSLYLWNLTSLPEGVTLTAGGLLDLHSLTSLSPGTTLTADGGIDLRSLTSLSPGITLTARYWLDLRSLTSEEQSYDGQKIRLRTIDEVCTRLIKRKMVGDVELWSAQYFRGNLDTDPRCYVAIQQEHSAHGKTPETALRDLRFKIASVDFDCDELVETIRERGTVTFNDYRLLTGACESGLAEGLQALGQSLDTDELPLDKALELCAGQYGGDRFRSLFLGAAK
jgi:hypothetical protein